MDTDPNFSFNVGPDQDWHQNDADPRADPTQVLNLLENQNLSVSNVPWFSLFWVGQHIEIFLEKKFSLSSSSFTWNWYRSGSTGFVFGKMMRNPTLSGSTTLLSWVPWLWRTNILKGYLLQFAYFLVHIRYNIIHPFDIIYCMQSVNFLFVFVGQNFLHTARYGKSYSNQWCGIGPIGNFELMWWSQDPERFRIHIDFGSGSHLHYGYQSYLVWKGDRVVHCHNAANIGSFFIILPVPSTRLAVLSVRMW